ncbi:four-carbon acid sugar kinase family protein [uncultured Castellaniella sp.]|uniref:four-carbon acid sugar kinase family protein n=1 Tax=uncultured Castellaniella sp. TaxID=647907 RepID=UPI00262FAB13|nr:four-carbon acid sugar kinase family protein [uncultured Castellaniella sp.]
MAADPRQNPPADAPPDASDLKLVFYADDFTGATDTLATVARAGLRATLFLRLPTAAQRAAVGPQDCLGIAGASRSMTRRQLQAELGRVADHVAPWHAPVVHYKTCSTFDSGPSVGNIGLAVKVLRERLPAGPFVPIVGGQPNLGRYCVFGNLFAAFQVGGEVFRLDRHPTMSRHPVTPMDESDLRRHLARQGLKATAGIAYPAYDEAPDRLDARVAEAAAAGPDGVLLDVAAPAHLAAIGRILWDRARRQPLLAVGPSSVEQALLTQWVTADHQAAAQAREQDASDAGRPDGPVLVFSGSLSPRTARQIQAARSYERVPVAVGDLLDGASDGRAAARDRIVRSLRGGHHVLAHWVDRSGAAAASRLDPAQLARAGAGLAADVLREVRPGRLGLSGGDTSSHCMQALDAWALTYRRTLEPGVALCRLHADSPGLGGLTLMLKGGQMGSDDIFERLLV